MRIARNRGARLEGFLPERPNLVERNGFGGGRCLLTRALLASNPGKRLPQVGFDAVGVTKRTIEDRFHETPPNAMRTAAPTAPVLTQDAFRRRII